MTALNPNSTARLWVDYTVGGFARSAMYRFATLSEAIAAAPSHSAMMEGIRNKFYTNVSFLGARVADVGTNVTNPASYTTVVGDGTTTIVTPLTPRFHSTVGRDAGGHKARWYFYGIEPSAGIPNDFRISGEEDANVLAVFSELTDWLTELNAVTIGGAAPTFANYVNVAFSAYHQRALRG